VVIALNSGSFVSRFNNAPMGWHVDEHTVFTPVLASSSGRLRTCSVICTRVRGIRRVRSMLCSVLWSRVSRCRSLGPRTGMSGCCLEVVRKDQ